MAINSKKKKSKASAKAKANNVMEWKNLQIESKTINKLLLLGLPKGYMHFKPLAELIIKTVADTGSFDINKLESKE